MSEREDKLLIYYQYPKKKKLFSNVTNYRGEYSNSVMEHNDIKEKHEKILKEAKIEYVEKLSSSSCFLSNILGFMFGGFSSRFWALRKYVNSVGRNKVDDIFFHCWECLSLETPLRDIDIVIKNETNMNVFLKYLITEFKTQDGKRGSAVDAINLLKNQFEIEMPPEVVKA